MKCCRLLVQELPGRILLDGLEPLPNGVFGEFENLAGAAFRDSYVAEAEGLFLRVALIPKVIETIGEEVWRNCRLVLHAERVNWFVAVGVRCRALADVLKKLQFDEWAIEVVLQDFSFSAPCRNVGVEEGCEVMLQGNRRQLFAEPLGFLGEGGKRLAAGKIGTVPEVEEVVPSEKRLAD